jgi:CheY-like chemotaxis protein
METKTGRGAPPPVALIEDDEDTRAALRFLLEDAGYRVVEAADGAAGLSLLSGSPERLVVLLDHKLPALDGCDLLDLVAQDSALRERHAIIFVTASPQQAEADCGEALTALDTPLVPKPFSIDEVLEAVAQAVERLVTA